MERKRIYLLAGGLGAVSFVTYRTISEQMFNSIFSRKKRPEQTEQKYLDWIAASNVDKAAVSSLDGLLLDAYDIHNHDDNKYIILVHGIASSKSFSYERAYEFDKLGYNTLVIDQRAAGDSEGDHYTFGQKESLDILVWIDYLLKKDPAMKIILYGVSMGAATIMMATANDLPDNVCCIIEDCGYSDLKEVFAYRVAEDYKLKFPAPVVKMLENKMRSCFGITMRDISPKKCLESNEIPIMFIHGDQDEVVPFKMALALYNHNKGPKKYYPIKGAGHTKANTNPHYYENIDRFIRENL